MIDGREQELLDLCERAQRLFWSLDSVFVRAKNTRALTLTDSIMLTELIEMIAFDIEGWQHDFTLRRYRCASHGHAPTSGVQQ